MVLTKDEQGLGVTIAGYTDQTGIYIHEYLYMNCSTSKLIFFEV